MPAGVRKAPSVAPADMKGTTGTPGHILAVRVSTGPKIFGSKGCGPLGTSLRLSAKLTLISGSATSSCSLARTCSGVVPGKMRQLILASARWGKALLAWPALNKVGTQVVCSTALKDGLAASVLAAAISPLEKAVIASATALSSTL